MDRRDPDGRDDGPWYETAVLYTVDVRSFLDTDADGVGDLCGLLRKLEHLQELGVSGLCLLPFYPPPLRDHGHDVADHRRVQAGCGHMREFTALVREAHRRGIRVLVDFVLGHISEQPPWFQEARRARRGSAAPNDSRAGKPEDRGHPGPHRVPRRTRPTADATLNLRLAHPHRRCACEARHRPA